MDAAKLAAEVLDRLPANRTLGLTVTEACDGLGRARLPVAEAVRNVIGALHSSGIVALADAAALAAVLSTAPDEKQARRLQPFGTHARVEFQRPVRAVALATCELAGEARVALEMLYAGGHDRARFTTQAIIDGPDSPHHEPPASPPRRDEADRLPALGTKPVQLWNGTLLRRCQSRVNVLSKTAGARHEICCK